MIRFKARGAVYAFALLLIVGGVGLAAGGGAPALPTPIAPFDCGT